MLSVFNPATYQQSYSRLIGARKRPVSILVEAGGDYFRYDTYAFITQYRESDPLPSSSVQVGDTKVILLFEDVNPLGITRLGLKDRINFDGRTFAVVHWDAYTRSIADTILAYEVAVKGGGLATIASVSVYRIIGSGDSRITGDGDRRIVKEAV